MKEKQECIHENESPFKTTQKRVCPKCGKIYYYDLNPIDWKKNFGIKNEPLTKTK